MISARSPPAARRAAAAGPRCARRGRRRAGRRAAGRRRRVGAAGELAVVQAEDADHPVRDRAHRHQRADRQMAGAEVRPGRDARAAARPAARAPRPARAARRWAGARLDSAATSSRMPLELAPLPGVALARRGERVGGAARSPRPARGSAGVDSRRVRRRASALDELGEAPGEVDRAALDVVERQHPADAAAGPPRSSSRRRASGRGPCATCSPSAPPSPNGSRCGASKPQRMPLAATQSWIRTISSSSKPKRRRTGSRAARSSSCEAVARWSARSSSWETTVSTRVGLAQRAVGQPDPEVGQSARVRRLVRLVDRLGRGRRPAPKVAWISGANVSMSGHITITSRGSSVGSSSSRWRIASRSTSTWRARPWQAWICTLRSPAATRPRPPGAAPGAGRRGCRPGGGRAGCPATLRPAMLVVIDGLAGTGAAPAAAPARRGPTRRAAGWPAAPAVGSSRAGRTAPGVHLAHASPERGRRVQDEQVHVASGPPSRARTSR